MRGTEPPRIARWMLERFMPEGRDEALKGDLLESYRAGRSRGWYWRQVIAALAIACLQSYIRHRFVILYATAWCMLSPAWSLILRRLQNNHRFGGFVWSLPWPWSTVCDFGFSAILGLLFVWAGAVIYILLVRSKLRAVSMRQISRGFTMSFAGYSVIAACLIAFTLITVPHIAAHVVDWRTLTLQSAVTDFGIWALPMRLPYLVGMACALWGFVPGTEQQLKPAR
jgi:hypothetical protein